MSYNSGTGYSSYNSYENIKKREDQLRKTPKPDLLDIVKRNYRVIDVKEMDKWSAIDHILVAEFGRKKLDEFYKKEGVT